MIEMIERFEGISYKYFGVEPSLENLLFVNISIFMYFRNITEYNVIFIWSVKCHPDLYRLVVIIIQSNKHYVTVT